MKLSSKQQIEQLKEKIRILDAENALLTELEENIFILSQVGELLGLYDDPDTLIRAVAERVSHVKNIPLILYLVKKKNQLFVQNLYFSRFDLNCAQIKIKMPDKFLQNDPICLKEGTVEFTQIQFSGFSDLKPRSIILMPQHDRRKVFSLLMFVDETRDCDEIGKLTPTLQHISEMTFRRLDGLLLQKKLEDANVLLGKTVGLQTADLLRANQQLKESEADYRVLFDSSPDAVFIHPAEGDGFGRFVDVNQVACKRYGYTHDEFLTLSAADISDPSHRHKTENRQIRDKIIQKNKNIYEVWHYTKSGKKLLVEISSTVINFREKKAILSIARDISEREKMQRKLKETEERFRLAFQTSPDSLTITRVEDGLYIDVNQGFTTMSGYTREEVMGHTALEINIWHDLMDREKLVDGLKKKGAVENLEAAFLRKNGEIIHGLMSANTMMLQGKPHILLMVRNIENLKRMEIEREGLLKETESARKLLHDVFARIADGVVALDKNWRYTYLNNRAAIMFNREKPQELLGKEIWAEFPEGVGESFYKAYHEAMETQQVVYFRDYYVPWNRWFENRIYPSVDGLTIYFTDITDQKHAEEEIRKLSLAVEQSPVAVVLTDTEGVVEYVNPFFTKMTGYDFDEIQGKNLRILKSKNNPIKNIGLVWQTISSGKVWEGEFQNVKKDGRTYWVRASISPLFNPMGDISHYLSIQEDITEKKKLENQFHQSQKMEAIGHLAGGVAHDFNNLLTIINGYCEIALLELKPADPQFEKFQQIREAGYRASALTRQLLAFSRKQIMKTEVLNLNILIQNMEKMLRRIITEDIKILIQKDENLDLTKVDRGQIEQVILNLVVNARDAMVDGGVLTIETRNIELTPEFVRMHKDAQTGAFVVLSVSDTGVGMDEKIKEHIFDPFFTTKERGRGTGLGLSTVYGIVKQSGGTVWVYSEPGMGTTFNIYLPRAKEMVPVHEAPATLYDNFHGTETILIAEDEDGVRNLVAHGLVEFGYAVLLASNSKDAMELMKKNRKTIKLLLTDVIMPGGSGDKLAADLSIQNPDLKVLFMSGYTNENIARHGVLNAGINFIQKPFSLHNLIKKVREVLDMKD